MKKANARLRDYAREHGDFALQEAISRGQYSHADGLYFGGAHMAWSAAMLKDVFVEELAHVKRLIAIDFPHRPWRIGRGRNDHGRPPGFGRLCAREGDVGRAGAFERGGRIAVRAAHRHDRCGGRAMDERQGTHLRRARSGHRADPRRVRALRKDNWLHTRAKPGYRGRKAIKSQIPRCSSMGPISGSLP
jgi:hypothetical protein